MAKKKAGTKKSGRKKTTSLTTEKAAPKKATKRTRKSTKGGFSVFVVTNTKDAVALSLMQIVNDLKDTADAERWIRENATEYANETLIIGQLKKTVVVRIQTTTSITLE